MHNMKERKLALVLLDIVNSTAFVQKVGAVVAARILQHHDRLARSVCYKNNGREIDRSDGFLLSFDSIQDAVKFALDYNKSVTPRIKLQSRIGIHWGSVVEVYQAEVYVDAGAKKVELEGIAKNIAARTMSVAMPSQILMTKDTYTVLQHSAQVRLPKDARFACVGVYRFKGVAEPQVLYAVSTDYARLQPPPGNDKAVRLGGPKYIKKLARDRQIMDYFNLAFKWVTFFGSIFAAYVVYSLLRSKQLLHILNASEFWMSLHTLIITFEKWLSSLWN
jgi:class 3 adenylate cyclase